MGITKKARLFDFLSTEEETVNQFKKVLPEDRLNYLENLREAKLGDKAKEPVQKIIRILPL